MGVYELAESPDIHDIECENNGGLSDLSTHQNIDNGFPGTSGFDPNTTQTNALLNIEDDQFNVILQQMYYSPKCSYFYIALLVMSFLLIIVTVVDGFKITKSGLFIAIEAMLNILITADFSLRLRLVGKHAFFKNPQSGHYRWWNIFDAAVVVICTLAFLSTLVFRSGASKAVGETSEELLLVAWAFWQTLRMILIVKKQKQAQQSAKTLINFDNVILDTDFASVSFRAESYGHKRSSDPSQIFGTESKDTKKSKKSGLVSAIGGAFKRQESNRPKPEKGIEMKDFNNIDHYVIDDDDLPAEEPVRVEKRANRPSREIVFDANSDF
jgi:hypothetical protein